MGLQISIRESDDVTILDLQGRVTIGVDSDLLSGQLENLVANGVRNLLLNLADVTQVDSSGVSVIVGTYVSLRRQGGSLKLLCPCGRVRAVLQVIHMPEIIPSLRMRLKLWPASDRRVTLPGPDRSELSRLLGEVPLHPPILYSATSSSLSLAHTRVSKSLPSCIQ